MKRIALAAVAAISMVAPASAAFTSIDQVRAMCETRDGCSYWIAGTVDAYLDAQRAISEQLGAPMGFCLPEDTTVGIVADLFREHLNSTQANGGSWAAAPEFYSVLEAKYPCR